MAAVGSLNATLGLNSTGFSSGLKKAQNDTKSFVGGMSNMSASMKSFDSQMGSVANLLRGGAIMAVVGAVKQGVEMVEKYGVGLQETAEQMRYFNTAGEGMTNTLSDIGKFAQGTGKLLKATLFSGPPPIALAEYLFGPTEKQKADFATIQKLMDGMRKQMRAFGLDAAQLAKQQLSDLGARKEDIAEAVDIAREMERLKTQKADQDAAIAAIKRLKEEIQTFGMATEAVENYRIQQSRASADSKKRVSALTDEIRALREKGEAEKAAAKEAEKAAEIRARAMEDSQRRVGSIRDKFMDYMKDIKGLMPQGGAFGSREARARIDQINSGTGGKSLLEKLTQDQINELKKHGDLLRNIKRAIEQGSDEVELGTAWF